MIRGLRQDQLHVFVEGLTLDASIGILPEERQATQPVRVDIDLIVTVTPPLTSETIADTVSYADVVDAAAAIVAEGHIELVETLAERIANAVLADPRVAWARVRVAKPQIIARAAAVGVTIERGRRDPPPGLEGVSYASGS